VGKVLACWAFAWPEDATSGGRDLGGWHEHAGEIEVAVARLIVGERDIAELVGISPADLSWAAGMIAGMVRVRRFQERSPMVSR
jgi:hypothetical protein